MIKIQSVIKGTSSFILTGFLINNISYANYQNTQFIENQCLDIANQLIQLVQSKPEDVCAGDLKVAISYIEKAGMELRDKQFPQALIAIKYSQKELKEISEFRSYCVNFDNQVRPLLDTIVHLGIQAEILENEKD